VSQIKLEDFYLQVNHLKIHAVQSGPEKGELILLLHGFPEYWRGWKNQIEPLASAGYRVCAPDQRGYNLSDKPEPISAYQMKEVAQDVLGIVEHLGRDKTTLIGHDWGGGVAWWLGSHYPEIINRMVILNMPHPQVMLRTLLRNPGQVSKSLYAAFFQIPRLPEAILRNNDWELLVENLQRSSLPGTFSAEDIEHYRRAWWQEGAMTAMLNWYRANLRYPPSFPREGSISVPTLVIWGAQDPALSREMAQESADMCTDARLVMFEDATHWVQHEKAEEVNALLLEFLTQST
jgi:pimeloyl-ACP methyl ester carboxylesterase